MHYADYVEKHVKLDIIMDKFVKHYFVDLRSFPFTGEGIYGSDPARANVFMIWDYHYRRSLQKKKIKETRIQDAQDSRMSFENEEVIEKTWKSHFEPKDEDPNKPKVKAKPKFR